MRYNNNSNGVPSYMAGQVGGAVARARARSSPNGRCFTIAVAILDRAAALARSACRTLLRTNVSWMNWRRARKPIRSHSGCVT